MGETTYGYIDTLLHNINDCLNPDSPNCGVKRFESGGSRYNDMITILKRVKSDVKQSNSYIGVASGDQKAFFKNAIVDMVLMAGRAWGAYFDHAVRKGAYARNHHGINMFKNLVYKLNEQVKTVSGMSELQKFTNNWTKKMENIHFQTDRARYYCQKKEHGADVDIERVGASIPRVCKKFHKRHILIILKLEVMEASLLVLSPIPCLVTSHVMVVGESLAVHKIFALKLKLVLEQYIKDLFLTM